MINIRKGQLNKVGLSLSELSIVGDPEEYRFELKSENSKDVTHTFTKTPVSSTSRMQLFEITEPTDVAFTLTGYYTYEIYQTTANNLVEVGLLRVVAENEEVQEYEPSGTDQVYGSN